jgi:hypothetical protein
MTILKASRLTERDPRPIDPPHFCTHLQIFVGEIIEIAGSKV